MYGEHILSCPCVVGQGGEEGNSCGDPPSPALLRAPLMARQEPGRRCSPSGNESTKLEIGRLKIRYGDRLTGFAFHIIEDERPQDFHHDRLQHVQRQRS